MSNIQYERSVDHPKKPLPIKEQEASLKGTLISVFSIGAFIVICWVSVFALFISRN